MSDSDTTKRIRPVVDPVKQRRDLLAWFAECDLSAYSTAALEAAYRALVESDDEPVRGFPV